MTLVSAGGTYFQQRQQARVAEAQMAGVAQQQSIDTAALMQQRAEIADAGAAEGFDARRTAMIENARIRAAAGESGAGLQTARLLQAAGFEHGLQVSRIQRNTSNALDQNARSLYSTSVGATNKMRTIRASAPSAVSQGLAIAGSAAGGYAAGTDLANTLK